ncbi:MAG: LysR family transcriptional regulator [Clostridia bacterium]|nr:LysR family transcriptional regulator [Clostridia bacterium]
MDIRNIKTFVRVAELKSFTKAANELSFVQSTVTMQIKQLEKELGYPLFDRIGKRVSLTYLGERFLSYSYELLDVLGRASELDMDNEDIGGVLRIGVSESLLFGVIADILPDFKKRYKNLDIRIKTGHTPELIEELKQNGLDMVYVSTNFNTDPDLKCCYVRREKLVFLCSKEHKMAKRKKVPVKEIMEEEFLVTEREGICYGRLRELAAHNDTTFSPRIELDSVYVISNLVEKGAGIAFLPEHSVSDMLKEGTLKIIDVDTTTQVYYSQIFMHKGRWIAPFMSGFIEAIENLRKAD